MAPTPSPAPLRVTMLLYGDVELDSRVRREARTLHDAGHAVTIATLAPEPRRPYWLDEAFVVPLHPARRGLVPGDESPFRRHGQEEGSLRRLVGGGRWAAGYAQTFVFWVRAALRRLPATDVWHGHDLLGLLAASALRRKHGGALVHDSHELFMEAGSAARLPGPFRGAMRRLEGRASRAADAVITVNDIIAAELRTRYDVDPIVVMNCPPLGPPPVELVLRRQLGVGDRQVVIHHGVIGPGRGIEQLIDAVPHLPAETVVVLLGRGPLVASIARIADGPMRGRLFVHPAVPMTDVPGWIGDADVGVIPFQAVDRNNVLATPNKLFEYLAAGIPMVVSDFPAMRQIVAETDAGLAADATDPRSLGAAIRELLEEPAERRAARRRSARAAYESTYNWQAQSAGLIGAYAGIASRRDLEGATRRPVEAAIGDA